MTTRFAFVSHVLPPARSGQSVVIQRMLAGLHPSRYCLVSQGSELGPGEEVLPRLPAPVFRLKPKLQVWPHLRTGRIQWSAYVNLALSSLARRVYGRQILEVVRVQSCEAIVAASGSLTTFPAALWASQRAGVPLHLYMFDDFVYQWMDPRIRQLVNGLQAGAVNEAVNVIVPNEFLGRAIQERYITKTTVVRNPCPPFHSNQNRPFEPIQESNGDEASIVYTGAVYNAHYDAFRNLLAAMQLVVEPELRLHVYTATPDRLLRMRGIDGPVTIHPHQPSTRIPEIHRRADLLFLPLAFDSPYKEVIRTSSPGKMGDYLAAGKPVLVHAPSDSFVSWYFRRYRCGIVVDKRDPALLAKALQMLLSEPELQVEISANAIRRAQDDFDVGIARQRFFRTLSRE